MSVVNGAYLIVVYFHVLGHWRCRQSWANLFLFLRHCPFRIEQSLIWSSASMSGSPPFVTTDLSLRQSSNKRVSRETRLLNPMEATDFEFWKWIMYVKIVERCGRKICPLWWRPLGILAFWNHKEFKVGGQKHFRWGHYFWTVTYVQKMKRCEILQHRPWRWLERWNTFMYRLTAMIYVIWEVRLKLCCILITTSCI